MKRNKRNKRNKRKQSIISELENLCKSKNYPLIVRANNHITIKGPLTVHYYPFSKGRTAYVESTRKGCKGCTPKDALLMAEELPTRIRNGGGDKPKRKQYRKYRKRLIEQGKDACHWCGIKLTLDTSTMDHVIPLSRGGLDHECNRVLSCEPCNSERADKMPELKKN